MTVEQLVRICNAYAALGSAIQGQITEVILNGEPAEDMNPNALKLARTWLADARGLDTDEANDGIAQLTEAQS